MSYMAKISKFFLIFLFVTTFSGCANQLKPNDFSFEYDWFGKMVPAPEHNEYIISVDQNGKGKLLYYADYSIKSIDESKLWKREFTLTSDQMEQAYNEMKIRNIFVIENTVGKQVNVKENYGTFLVKADKINYFVKVYNSSDDNAKELEQIIKKMVPDNFWIEMDAQIKFDTSRNNDVLDYELPELEY